MSDLLSADAETRTYRGRGPAVEMHRLCGHVFLPSRGSNTAGYLHCVHRLRVRQEGPIRDRWHGHRPVRPATFRVVLERAHPAPGGDRRDLRPALHRWDLPRLQLGTAHGTTPADPAGGSSPKNENQPPPGSAPQSTTTTPSPRKDSGPEKGGQDAQTKMRHAV